MPDRIGTGPRLRGTAGGLLVALVALSGLIGALLLARPALVVEQGTADVPASGVTTSQAR
jgi:hypothetical protein